MTSVPISCFHASATPIHQRLALQRMGFFLHLGQRTAREHTAQGGQSGNDGLDDEAPETTPLFTLIDGIEIDHSVFSFKG